MYLLTGSVTSAERLAKALESAAGYPAYVVHTPSGIKNGGCSYSVRCDERILPLLKDISQSQGIKIKGIYQEKYENGERVYVDIS
ncbi:MAG: putative Se/S carrier-like protein [Clostridia bacterium]|nr:putative Se/S carrier-like protein [Clostridia bacterium]